MLKKLSLLIFLLVIGNSVFAGVTGKIAGILIDSETKQPLPGVNVIIQGTTMGASTDQDGYYVILNIPPDTYTLQAMYVGYTTIEVKEVKVSVDLTTKIDIELSETTLETSETITVIAERPVIRRDAVSTRHFVSSEEIEIQPVNSFQEIARNQAGVVGNHFRGGRTGEVLVLIDGIPIRDPAGVYSGDLGGFTSDVPEYAIQELDVSLGGFSAEYGNVQSGLLNLALKEGARKFSGRLRFTHSPSFGSSKSLAENGIKFKQLQPVRNIYELNLNGPIIPGRLSFSISGKITDKNNGFYINQKSFDQNYQGKITYKFSPQHKLAIGGIFSKSNWDQYYFPASKYGPGDDYEFDMYNAGVENDTLMIYRYVEDKEKFGTSSTELTPGGVADGDSFDVTKTYYMAGMQEYLWDRTQTSNIGYILWTHALNEYTFYEIRLNTYHTNYHYATPDVDDRDGDGDRDEDLEWNVLKSGPHPIYREREENYWWVRGDDPGYRDQTSWTNTIKADLVSQFNANNLFKGGIEFSLHQTEVENISWTLGVGTYRRDIWDEQSFDFAAYLQDKLEFRGIIALIGLRFDAFSPNGFDEAIVYPADYNYPYTEVGEDDIPIFTDPQKAENKYQLSPRIGISHPITDQSVLHFNYGHYFQRADGYYLYRNHKIQSLTKVGNYVGHPNLEPEKTVAYELGIEQQFSTDLRFTLTGYYKDITNLMNWHKYVGRSIQNVELNVYTNADYGNIKGMELTINKRPGRFWGGSINYTYSIAKGRSSSASGGSGSFTDAKRMNFLSHDQTHTVNANITLRTPSGFGTGFGKFHPFSNWTANIQFDYGSGLPYSSYGTNKINDKRMPWTSATDIKIMRQFKISNIGVNIFVDIFNLFDSWFISYRRNVDWIGNSQYYDSGDPDDPTIKGDPSVVRRNADLSYARNPQAYGSGRHWRFGLGLHF